MDWFCLYCDLGFCYDFLSAPLPALPSTVLTVSADRRGLVCIPFLSLLMTHRPHHAKVSRQKAPMATFVVDTQSISLFADLLIVNSPTH